MSSNESVVATNMITIFLQTQIQKLINNKLNRLSTPYKTLYYIYDD